MSWNSVRRNRRKPISGQPKHEIFRKTTVTTVALQSVKTCENQWRAAQSQRISKVIPGDPFGCFVFEHHHFGWFSITSGMLLLSRMSVGSISISSRNPWLTQVIWKINNIHQFLIQNRWRLRVFSPTVPPNSCLHRQEGKGQGRPRRVGVKPVIHTTDRVAIFGSESRIPQLLRVNHHYHSFSPMK